MQSCSASNEIQENYSSTRKEQRKSNPQFHQNTQNKRMVTQHHKAT